MQQAEIHDSNERKYLTLRLPSNLTQAQLLVGVLVIGAFFLGMLFQKVQYLQKGGRIPTGTVQAAQQPAVPQRAQAPQPTLGKQNVDVGHFPPKGDSNAKVTVVAFEDFRCPFCERLFTDVETQLQKEYIDTGKVKFYYRNYQFLGPASVVAGNAAECANEQNKFWEFHEYLYKNQPSETDTSMFTTDKMTEIAGTLGLDTAQFKSCLSSNKYQKNLDQDMADGQKAGVSATPTLFVNGNPVVGAQPYSAFKTLIDQELSK